MTLSKAEIDELVAALRTQLPDSMVLLHRAQITAHDNVAKTVTLMIGPETMESPGASYFTHYSPTVGDDVHYFKVGPDVMVIGKIARP